MMVSVLSMYTVPIIDLDGDRILVTYDLYIDRTLRKTYRYAIVSPGMLWVGTPLIKPLLPATWTQSIWNDADWNNAIIGTAKNLWLDAHQDGYF